VSADGTLGARLLGRTFLSPAADYLLIGGGLSLLTTAWLLVSGSGSTLTYSRVLPWILLFCNFTHFSSTSVRLYTKPGAFGAWPFVTMGLPLASLLVLALCMARPESLGSFLQRLYLSWSPYHYAAQAYGLATMYCYRSGCLLAPAQKKLLFWTSMVPFVYMMVGVPGIGLSWILPAAVVAQPGVAATIAALTKLTFGAAVVAPLLLFASVLRSPAGPMPLISLLVVVSNSVWFFVLQPLGAMTWATIFHGLQYLAIVLVFHVRDQVARPGNTTSAAMHGLRFYVTSLLLAYALFLVLPRAWVLLGFGPVESALLVLAAINIHHFVVDAYIWRLKKTDGNRRIVDALSPVPAVAA
jgi:hypothetical protein